MKIKEELSGISERQFGQGSSERSTTGALKTATTLSGRSNNQGRKHNCKFSKECNTDWDILGCVEFYSIAKLEERKTFCK